MSQIAEQLAELTGFRDRDLLDVSLVSALKELLEPQALAIYRAVGEPGQQHWITRARLVAGQSVPSADGLWTEIESLPTLTELPQHAQCLAGEAVVEVAGTPRLTLFPIASEREAVGVLEIATAQPLPAEQARLVFAILRIYRNFQGLLDYSERDTLTGLLNRKTFDECFLRMTVAPAGAKAPGTPTGAAASDAPTGTTAPDTTTRAALPDAPTGATALDASAGTTAPDAPAGPAPAELRQESRAARAYLGVIDIDHFKRVNDGFGHLIGDEVLLLLSRLMRSSFRYHDQLFRFGGEEFVVLMRCARPADAAAAFERLRANVERYAFPRVGRITVSIGISELRPGDTPSAGFERADKAVYHAKQHGRNQVHDHAALVAAGHIADESRASDIELF